jgi:catechol 2,3-dioxygenase-like lactoylglutathione lyase family enzyme
MIPVLAVQNPEAACQWLSDHFGFTPVGPGQMAFGAAHIAVAASDDLPANLVPLRLDHVAFAVADADAVSQAFGAAGALLDPTFTPGGPRDIPQFWDSGVRFVFFQGPHGAPFEFCAKNNAGAAGRGHSHFAIRARDMDAAETQLATFGAKCIAQHLLPGAPRPVAVRFLQSGPDVYELFDEAPVATVPPRMGWVGLLPIGA